MAKPVLYDESTLIGSSRNKPLIHRDKVYLISRFDEQGRKTSQVHTRTFIEMENEIMLAAQGLDFLGAKPGDTVAVFGPNNPRWITTIGAVIAMRGVFVPIYPTSKAADVSWILQDSKAKFVACHGTEHLQKVLAARKSLENLEGIIILDPDVESDEPGVIYYDELLQKGMQNVWSAEQIKLSVDQASPQDLVSIIYTSGTTGRPKGVMLTNDNFISQRPIAEEYGFTPNDVWFGHLPLCHVLGFTADLLNSTEQGGKLYVTDSLQTEDIRMNLRACRPTVMNSVPMLWEKIFIQIQDIVGRLPKGVQRLFSRAVEIGKEKYLLETAGKPVPLALRIKSKLSNRVFRRVKKEAGLDRLRLCCTGGGPISPDLIVFFGSMGIDLYQGYGLTETSPITHACTPAANRIGSVGKAIPGTDCRIADDGEILVRGPQVTRGYLNNDEATAEAFTDDGFFKTGDVGEIDEAGYLRITDRKKEILITSGGKNVAPQPIENLFNTEPYIEAVCLIGDDRKYLTALIVPDFEMLTTFAKRNKIKYENYRQLLDRPDVKALFEESVNQVNGRLARYETIKKFTVLDHEFTPETGQLTPTLKKKRKVIQQMYKQIIEDLYQ